MEVSLSAATSRKISGQRYFVFGEMGEGRFLQGGEERAVRRRERREERVWRKRASRPV